MVFSSTIFLLFYLPLVLTAYHLLFLPVHWGWHPAFWRRASNLFLLAVSLLFYFWGENWLIWILLTSMLTDYVCALWIAGGFQPGTRHSDEAVFSPGAGSAVACLSPATPRSRTQKFALLLSIISNLAFLGYFKYFNFGLDTYNSLVTAINALPWRGMTWYGSPCLWASASIRSSR